MPLLNQSTVDFVRFVARRYPGRTVVLVVLLVLSGLSEGFGVVSLLPLLELAISGDATDASAVTELMVAALAWIGAAPTIGVLLACIVTGMLLKACFRLLAMKQVGYMVSHVATDLRLSLIRALLQSRWRYFISQPTGRFANAMSSEANRTSGAYKSVVNMLAAIIQAGVYVTIAILVSWQVALVAVLCGVLVMVALGRLVEMSRAAARTQSRLMRSLITRLTDSLQGIKAIKAMGREEHLQPLLESETRGINKAQERQVIATEAVVAAQEPILVVLLAGGLLAVLTYTATSFASVLVMAFLFHRLAGRIGTIQINYQAITAGEHYFWSLRESIAGAEAERERSAGMKPPEVSRGIILDRVSFAYSDDVVLQDVSLTIPARGMVALFGPSGVGKTTVADLVVGLYTPTSGRILIDGIPLDSIDLANWRQRIGYVPQEMFLFHDTVFANLALGDPDVTRADAERALTAAGAGTFVAALPEGLDTVLGERGSRLSGGQRQRIAIARALIRRPSLLVLDEVTTALDPATEAAICQTLQELATETAILAISHQPAITQAADVVYRLQDGKAIRADPVAPVTT